MIFSSLAQLFYYKYTLPSMHSKQQELSKVHFVTWFSRYYCVKREANLASIHSVIMGSNRQKKGFSLFSMFKSKKSRRSSDDYALEDNTGSGRRVWPSDEDKGSWVAEPGIDRRAQEFIAKFHAIRVSESELRAVCQTGASTEKKFE